MSRSPSPVKARATAFPGPAKSARSALTSERTGPCRVARIVSWTSAPPFTWIVSSRVSNGFGPSGREIFRRVGRIDGLDEQVLNVRIRGRQSPRDRIVLAEHEDRGAGQRRALDRPFRRDDAGQIPEDRRAEVEMRIVGEDRLSGQRPRSGDHPFVRCALADSGQGPELIIDAVVARVRVAYRWQGRDRIAGPRAGKEPVCPFRLQAWRRDGRAGA